VAQVAVVVLMLFIQVLREQAAKVLQVALVHLRLLIILLVAVVVLVV
jgi:hypothetical protein